MILEKYSLGVGDRFGQQGRAQLDAFIKAKESGIECVPVWNKSFREHSLIGTAPSDTRKEADEAVKTGGWTGSYYVDADHINIDNVESFIECSDFFTLDIADYIGQSAPESELADFADRHRDLEGDLAIDGIETNLTATAGQIGEIGAKYLYAVKEAGRIYRRIESVKGAGNFIIEVSMDETDQPQTPVELLFILAAIADEHIPAQTIAPKFTGRFNKGVDYIGDVDRFGKEFNDDLAVIRFAVGSFAIPANLKLSIHSGSDKFSIYGPIGRAIAKFDAGLHLKTAGTTWLEELIGLAEAGGEGLKVVKDIYSKSMDKYDALSAPYAPVIDIDKSRLPTPAEVDGWDGKTLAATLRHDQSCELYNPNFRQMLHIAYKIAADMGDSYLEALRNNSEIVAHHVSENILERHIKNLFML